MKRENIINLFEIYKEALSIKEREYFEYYYYEDYSLSEIADIYKLSRAYVGKYLKTIESKLLSLESSLKVNERNEKIKELLKLVDDENIKGKIEDLL